MNEEVLAVHLALTIILTVLSCLGIIFSIVCLLFNFFFRNTKYAILLLCFLVFTVSSMQVKHMISTETNITVLYRKRRKSYSAAVGVCKSIIFCTMEKRKRMVLSPTSHCIN